MIHKSTMAMNRHDIQISGLVITTYNIQWIKISIMDEDIWYILESSHESWNLINTGMIKEVAYVECHQFGKSSTQTATSTCPTIWIEVSRSNIVVHCLITVHWCIPLTYARSPVWSPILLWRKLPMAWGTTTNRVTIEINPFPYAKETKYLTLKDLETYLISGWLM